MTRKLRTKALKRLPNESRIFYLMRKQRASCFYCECMVAIYPYIEGMPPPLDSATVDHVVPRSKGGKGGPKNTVLACLRCNRDKANLDLETFMRQRVSKVEAATD